MTFINFNCLSNSYLPLLKEALILSKSLDSQGTYSWITLVKNITSDQNIFDKTSKKIRIR
jgi:hypothetical protein